MELLGSGRTRSTFARECSNCVYATCRDATDSFRVIVPREAVGERCDLMHEVFLLDIDIDLADVMDLADGVGYLRGNATK